MNHKVWKWKQTLPPPSSRPIHLCSICSYETNTAQFRPTLLTPQLPSPHSKSHTFLSLICSLVTVKFLSKSLNKHLLSTSSRPGSELESWLSFTSGQTRSCWQEMLCFPLPGHCLELGKLREEPVTGHHWQSPTFSLLPFPPPPSTSHHLNGLFPSAGHTHLVTRVIPSGPQPPVSYAPFYLHTLLQSSL